MIPKASAATHGLGPLTKGRYIEAQADGQNDAIGLAAVGYLVTQLGGYRGRKRKGAGRPSGRNSGPWRAEAGRGNRQILACKYKFTTTQSVAQRPVRKKPRALGVLCGRLGFGKPIMVGVVDQCAKHADAIVVAFAGR